MASTHSGSPIPRGPESGCEATVIGDEKVARTESAASRLAGEDARLSRGAETGLFFFALALRLPTLALRHMVEGDGVHYAQLARAILAGDFSGLANPYWSNLWPAAIAATSWLVGLDVVAAGRVLSLLAGGLLAVVAARLAARCFGPTTGLVAGLLVADHPWLIHFSTLVFTESFFTLLLVALLLVAIPAVRATVPALGAGLLAGLAMVTRPEAYSTSALVLVWVVVRGWSQSRRSAVLRGLLFSGIVALCMVGRACAVHHYFDLWDFGVGVKGTANLFVGLADTDREKERLRTEVTASGDTRLDQAASETTIVGFSRAHPNAMARHVARNLVCLLGCTARVFPQIAPIGDWGALRDDLSRPMWIAVVTLALATCGLALLGIIAGLRDRGSRSVSSLLALTGGLYLLGLAPLNVHERLVVSLVPLFLIFVAHGLVRVAQRFRWARGRYVRGALVTLLSSCGVLALGVLLRAPTLDYVADQLVQRDAGRWLATHRSQDERIMTAAPAVGFYFYDAHHQENERSLPWADIAGVIGLARSQGVSLIVAPEWHLRAVDHPAASILLDPTTQFPGLLHVASLGDEARGRILVWQVRAIPEERTARP